MEESQSNLQMIEFPFSDVVSETAHAFYAIAQTQGKTLHCAVEPMLSITGNEKAIRQLVNLLMDNAMKYKRSEVPLSLEVRTWNAGGKFVLAIKDNGMGIRKENLKKIFDKFYRVQTGNVHDVKGFGLGLAYVKQVVEVLNGSIRAESEPGVGTEFVIVLPLK
jgi:two-component system phosphate regulon sensor histidine kinase PhoR